MPAEPWLFLLATSFVVAWSCFTVVYAACVFDAIGTLVGGAIDFVAVLWSLSICVITAITCVSKLLLRGTLGFACSDMGTFGTACSGVGTFGTDVCGVLSVTFGSTAVSSYLALATAFTSTLTLWAASSSYRHSD